MGQIITNFIGSTPPLRKFVQTSYTEKRQFIGDIFVTDSVKAHVSFSHACHLAWLPPKATTSTYVCTSSIARDDSLIDISSLHIYFLIEPSGTIIATT